MMIYNLSKKIAFYFVKRGIVPQEDVDVYRFGIETIICALVDIVIAVVVGVICRKLFYALWFFVIFAILRQMAEGYHARTFIGCKIMMFVMMFVIINIEPFIKSSYIFGSCVLIVLLLIKINDIRCNKVLLTVSFLGGEIVLYGCERGMALLMLMAFLVVMLAAFINDMKEVKR